MPPAVSHHPHNQIEMGLTLSHACISVCCVGMVGPSSKESSIKTARCHCRKEVGLCRGGGEEAARADCVVCLRVMHTQVLTAINSVIARNRELERGLSPG